LLDFSAESATSNRRLRLNRIRSRKKSSCLPHFSVGDYLQPFLRVLFYLLVSVTIPFLLHLSCA
jgi:hypothetical protein